MLTETRFDGVPLWGLYAATFVLLLLADEIGFRIGRYRHRATGEEESKSQASGITASILALLAFMLAFSFSMAATRFADRKQLVVDEANAIGTAWLRAGFLDEPDLSTTRGLLQEYTEIRIAAAEDTSQYGAAVARSEEIHNELWAIMEANVRQGKDSDIMGLVISSINDVIDIHAIRLAKANLRLPRVLGILLFTATILSFLLVGVASSADRKRDTAAMVLFALILVATLVVIIDLDRPQEGMLRVSQTAMTDLLRQITPPGQ